MLSVNALQSDRTLYAPATAPGRAAVAIVRISGPDAGLVLDRLTGRRRPAPRDARLRRIVDPSTGEVLDDALVLWLPGPGSFTGEDQVELHLHGGPAVLQAVLAVLAREPETRMAEPGEFTRRAFLNGRLDLAAVEGLADLIDAETEAQRRQAQRQLDGVLGREVAQWREDLLQASVLHEAVLDFSDEDDVPDDVMGAAGALIAKTTGSIAGAIARSRQGESIRQGFVCVIAGPPNAGKSSLLNALAERDVAIVSEIAGTTRDALEVRCDLAGWPVTFVDTAGLRESMDAIETLGIARTRRRMSEASLVVWLSPADAPVPPERHEGVPVLTVRSKCDLIPDPATSVIPGWPEGPNPEPTDLHDDIRQGASREGGFRVLAGGEPRNDGVGDYGSNIGISTVTGLGLPELIQAVIGRIAAGSGEGDALVVRERHRVALETVMLHLREAERIVASFRLELAAEEIRLALRALGRITGIVDVEEVLGRIFSRFCIGK